MSFNDLFEALKGLITPFIARFERVEAETTSLRDELSELYDLELDERLVRVEHRLDAEAEPRPLEELVAHVVNDQSGHIITRLDEIEDDLAGLNPHINELERQANEAKGLAQEGAEALTLAEILEERLSGIDLDMLARVDLHGLFDYGPSQAEAEIDELRRRLDTQEKTIQALLKALEWQPPQN